MKFRLDNGILGGNKLVSWLFQRRVYWVASQVDLRVGQLLAVSPDSPLGVSIYIKGTHQDVELDLERTGSAYRRTTPVLLLGAFLPINGGV